MGGAYFLAHVDGHVYVPDDEDHRLHIEALTKVGGYARVPYPRFETPVWTAILGLIDALDGSERQEILDALECLSQGLVADDGAPVEEPHPAT